MNEDEWNNFKKVWESYGVNFQREDGTYKSTYELLKEMSIVWGGLKEEEKNGICSNER